MSMGKITTNSLYGVDEKCKNCFLRTYHRLFNKFNVGQTRQADFDIFFNDIFKREDLIRPEIQRQLNQQFCSSVGVTDPFADEKRESNRIALELYKEWKNRVIYSENPFDLALRLSIAGNIMDYGAFNDFDLHKTIMQVISQEITMDDSILLKKRIGEAKLILYLGDNAGEIVFDRLFIETMAHSQVVYAVKSAPVLNDVTMEDAIETGMDHAARVISNGYDAPSTYVDKCSDEFREIYRKADLIISKGQGNLEGLITMNDPRIFFILMVKCDVIAEILNVKRGSIVVFNPGHA